MSPSKKRQFWADVAVFEDINAGKAVESILRDKGLETRIHDDKLFRYFLFLRPPRVTYHLQVRHDQVDRADDFLLAGAPEALQKALHCPSCDSLRVSYPQMTRKFILPTILLHLGIIFRVIGHECYCDHCHYIWNLAGENVHAPMKPAVHFPFSKF